MRLSCHPYHSVAMTKRVLLPVIAGLVLYMCSSTSLPAAATNGSAADPVPARGFSGITRAQFENSLLTQLNSRRVTVGCSRLRSNLALTRSARTHSARMASAQTLSHQLPGEAWFTTRIHRAGYRNTRALAENVASGPADPGVLHAAWVNSAPHRANMDNCRLRDVGVGVVYGGTRTWATVDFGRQR